MKDYIIGITGASGAVYAEKLIKSLAPQKCNLHVCFSGEGLKVFNYELGLDFSPSGAEKQLREYFGQGNIFNWANGDFFAPVASGTFRAEAMIIVPCSMKTAGAVANGITTGLVERAADVMLKEKRRLIVVPRETPLSVIHLKNLLALAEAGAVIIPPAPAFYNHPQTIDELTGFVTGKILDQLNIEHRLFKRWGGFDSGTVD